jgi:Tat protein secretion system quality control protein TatD with DNase activity
VVLHGAKCWGEVTAACRPYAGRIPAFLFHGFSRSGGLVPDIVSLNGYFSVGPALLNDHAVNYRQLVASLPEDRLLVETDADYTAAETVPEIGEIVAGLAQARGKSVAACEAFLAANGRRFTETLR